MKIVGFFEVKAVEKASPDHVWSKYGSVGSTDREFFFGYYQFSESAIAISIGDVIRLDQPLSLPDLDGSIRPPQSFCYLSSHCLQRLRAVT